MSSSMRCRTLRPSEGSAIPPRPCSGNKILGHPTKCYWKLGLWQREKWVKPVPEHKVAAFLDRVLAFPCVPGAAGLYRQAFRLSRRYEIHPYDAAIVAAAQELGARTLYSEDLSDGQEYDVVKVLIDSSPRIDIVTDREN